jgi:Fe2+ transport system protein FeoA
MPATLRRDAPTSTLDRLRQGVPGCIVWVDPGLRDELLRDGLDVGEIVTVTGRGPLGGPLVVSLDRARLAVPLELARVIEVVAPVRRSDW